MGSESAMDVFVPRRVKYLGPFIGLSVSIFIIYILLDVVRMSMVDYILKSLFFILLLVGELLAFDFFRALRKVIFFDSSVTVHYEVFFLKRTKSFKYTDLIVDIRRDYTIVSFMKKRLWKRPISSYLNSVWDPDQIKQMEQILLKHKGETTIRYFKF